MNKKELRELNKIFDNYQDLKLVYLFGSRATGKANEASDYDFAIFLDSRDAKKNYNIKFALMDELGRFYKTDKIDVIILDTLDKPELKYNIIQEGILILEKEPFKVIVEPRILNEYFDFHAMLVRNGLTKSL